MVPYGSEISKRYFFLSFGSFSTKLFVNVSCDIPHKRASWNFEISNLF